jgi:hypothetical protein
MLTSLRSFLTLQLALGWAASTARAATAGSFADGGDTAVSAMMVCRHWLLYGYHNIILLNRYG